MTLDIILFIVGLIILYYGAEWLVKGSSGLARSLGLSPLVIGLTIVAFGTSSPEIVVSVVSSIKGKSMIAVGNVIGSNICNIALVLGLAALFYPVSIRSSVIQRDIPIMLAVSAYLFLISIDSVLGRIEGVTLMIGIILYSLFNYFYATMKLPQLAGDSDIHVDKTLDTDKKKESKAVQILLIIVGIGGVIGGAELLIGAAVKIMTVLGVSEKFIGLTMVAFGTSLPELATSVVAAFKKEMDISFGNLIGSNVFNILCVLGAASLVRPIHIPGGFFGSGLVIDYLVMIFISVLPWLMMRKSFKISRFHGMTLLGCYGVYLIYLIFKS